MKSNKPVIPGVNNTIPPVLLRKSTCHSVHLPTVILSAAKNLFVPLTEVKHTCHSERSEESL